MGYFFYIVQTYKWNLFYKNFILYPTIESKKLHHFCPANYPIPLIAFKDSILKIPRKL